MTYSANRDKWARWMQQQFALDVYTDYWNLDREKDIDEVDEYRERGGQMGDFSARLDYSGIDKIVHRPHGTIQLGQRIRTDHEIFDVDFTIRTSAANGHEPEFEKLKRAYQDPEMDPPRLYALGVAKETSRVRSSSGRGWVSAGLSKFYLVYTNRFLDSYLDGEIERVNTGGSNRDGSTFVPFSISDVKSIGAIAEEWSESDLDEITNRTPATEHHIQDQANLADFGGGA